MTGARRGRATATLAFDHIGSFADTTEDGNLYISIGVKAATRDAAGGVGGVSVASDGVVNVPDLLTQLAAWGPCQ